MGKEKFENGNAKPSTSCSGNENSTPNENNEVETTKLNASCSENKTSSPNKCMCEAEKTCCSCRTTISKSVKPKSTRRKLLIVVSATLGVVGVSCLIAWLINGSQGIVSMFDFVSDELLGMKWLNRLIGMALVAIFSESFVTTWYGAGLQFFVYDVIKIFVLLCTLIFVISYIQSYFPPERTKKLLSRFGGIRGNALGALLGTVTPFCSCSSIPIFMGFANAGVRSGVTFSFLISSPLVDLGAFILLVSVFGFPIAIAYVVVGLVLAIIGGWAIEKTGVGKHLRVDTQPIHKNKCACTATTNMPSISRKDRCIDAIASVGATIRKVWLYVLVGVGIGALIHNVIPTSWITATLGSDKWYSVFVATFTGLPMYADIFGAIPVAEALFAKGVGVGTILAFMMSVTALSLPSMIMLSKVIKPKLLFSFIGIVTAGILIIGFVFNALNFLYI